jgi:AbrB family looped-hinge helix DNA binding protein
MGVTRQSGLRTRSTQRPVERSLRRIFAQPQFLVAQRFSPYYNLFGKDYGANMSTEATLTSKGQTTIPKPIRDSLGMKTGDRMSFTLMPDGVVIMRVKNKRIAQIAGLLHKKRRKRLPIELLSR